jgi:hypothetical protein
VLGCRKSFSSCARYRSAASTGRASAPRSANSRHAQPGP